jgi:hypothetical protein
VRIDGASEPPLVTVGSELVVSGQGFVDGCDDQRGGDAFGCTEEEPEPEEPLADVDLVLKQRGNTWVLGTASAGSADDNELGRVTWDVVIPDDVRSGPARLTTAYSDPLRIEVNTALDEG